MAEHDVKHDIEKSFIKSQDKVLKNKELKEVCSSILRINKDSPFCIVDTSQSAQSFAIALKESARRLKNTIISLGGLDEQILLRKKLAYSTNPSIAIVTYIGDDKKHNFFPTFTIAVNSLATPQINKGLFLPANEKITLPPNTYSFDLGINGLNYEFQFNINKGDSHEVLLQRLSRLINNAGIGLNAYILFDDRLNCALSISSKTIGLPDNSQNIFTISDQNTSRHTGVVAYLGLNNDITQAANACFTINGKEQISKLNDFTVEKMFHVTLTGISHSEADFTTISIKQDVESIMENIQIFINSYHDFLKTAETYLVTHPPVIKLLNNMKTITNHHLTELERLGITVIQNGRLELQKDIFTENIKQLVGHKFPRTSYFDALKEFAEAVLSKTNDVQLNPMEYVDKKTVEYKNPEAPNYPCPYISSNYSGMMYNRFC